ncbi:MAG: GNAT family N-acetyltransferase [Spirochaetaceae bacterium]|nr:GNAT family N-acetyltransferase [Spirochaetaceae bacterium]
MAWSYFNFSQLEDLKNLIQLREHCCMNFSTIFRNKYSDELKKSFDNSAESNIINKFHQIANGNNSLDKFSEKTSDIIVHNNWVDSSIDFSLMLSDNGQLLPICRENIASKIINLSKGLEFFGNSLSKVNTIMGDKKSVSSILKNCFSNKIVSEWENSFIYYTMTLDEKNFIPCNLDLQEINIRIATQKDIENLLPLQKNYEIEEVLPSSEMFNEVISKKHLSMILKNQITVVAEKSGKIIAKANTNGKGFIYYQIGGVYTLPEYRNIGISTALVSYLIEKIFSQGMKASLFVKTNNPAALKVYINLGFNKMEEFQIIYFLHQ